MAFHRPPVLLVHDLAQGPGDLHHLLGILFTAGYAPAHVFLAPGSATARIVLTHAQELPAAIRLCHGRVLPSGHRCRASAAPVDALLFVGNLDPTLPLGAFAGLFTPFGHVLRLAMMTCPVTARAQGYGFVEFATPEQAESAKSALAAHVVLERTIRIDWVDGELAQRLAAADMAGDADPLALLCAQTLFIDKLPRKMLCIDAIIAYVPQ